MATNLIEIEEAILGRLAPVGVAIGVSINRLDSYQLNQAIQSGQVFVNYNGFRSEFPKSFNGGEYRTFSFQIVVRYVDICTHDQAYPLLAAISTALRGFAPLAKYTIEPMRIIREKPDTSRVADGLWLYVQDYEFKILEV